jgi:recombination protein RecA
MQRWNKQELELLKQEYIPKEENSLYEKLNRSPNAIKSMASRLNLNNLKIRGGIILSDAENQIILGSLLGDMYCRIKKTAKNAQIEEPHCKEQEPYLLWKVAMLKSLSFNVRRTSLGYLFFESRVYPCLNYYNNLFYKNKKKVLNIDVLDKLSPLGLAVWYMDDGSYNQKQKTCCLYTNGFTYEENETIRKWFNFKWDIYPRVTAHRNKKEYPNKTWFILTFNGTETKKFMNLIKGYIHPSMKYKLGDSEKNANSKEKGGEYE